MTVTTIRNPRIVDSCPTMSAGSGYGRRIPRSCAGAIDPAPQINRVSPLSAASVPPVVNVAAASLARVHDVLLGGCSNFAVDRRAAAKLISAAPWLRQAVWQNRSFIRRVVHFLIGCRVRQVLDLGCGLVTVGAVPLLVRRINAQVRVVCVDVDPLVVTHDGLVLDGDRNATAVEADIRDPAAVLALPQVRQWLDFTEPVAVLMLDVLPFVAEADRPAELVAGFARVLAAGSFVAVSHATADGLDAAAMGGMAVVRQECTNAGQPWLPRGRAEVAGWFDGLDLVAPGLVGVAWWRPDGDDEPCGPPLALGGVGRVRRCPS